MEISFFSQSISFLNSSTEELTEEVGASRHRTIGDLLQMNNLCLFVLFGPLLFTVHYIPSNNMDNDGLITRVERVYSEVRTNKLRGDFFNNCKKSKVLPDGLKLSFNLALGVNNPELVSEIRSILDYASTEILCCLEGFCVEQTVLLDEKLLEMKQQAVQVYGDRGFNKEFASLKRRVNFRMQEVSLRMRNKLAKLRVNNTFGPENSSKSHGSRRITALRFLQERIHKVRNLRLHRRNRHTNAERQKRRRHRE